MRRMLAAATVATLSFATFAGCSSQNGAAPAPTSTPSACSPDRATVTWDHGSSARSVLIGVYVLTYSTVNEAWESTYHPIAVSPAWDDHGILDITRTPEDGRAWRAALLASAERTGQVPSDFGAIATINPTDVDAPSGVPTKPSTHAVIEALAANQFTMPFSIRCAGTGNRGASGSVTASLTGAWASTFYMCGDTPTTDQGHEALRYCP